MSTKVVRVGGVGTGRIFQHAHLRVYPPLMHRARMVGFFDIDKPRAEEAKATYTKILEEYAVANPEVAELCRENISELRVYSSLDEILGNVDAIDICTHSKGRLPTAIAAFKKGVSAMAEKPMARVWTEADRAVRALAEAKDVCFQLNDDNFYEPKYRFIRSLIEHDRIGRVQTITLIRGSRLDAHSVLKLQANALENGGGCLMDYGSHSMAGTWSLLGPEYRPVKVEAVAIDTLYPHRILEDEPYLMEVEDNARLKVMFENAKTGSWSTVYLETTWCGGHIGRTNHKSGAQNAGYLEIVGDKGLIESFDATSITVKTWDGGEDKIPIKEYPGETISVASEVMGFLDALEQKKQPETSIEFGAEIIAVTGAGYLSAIRGKAVTLTQFKNYCQEFINKHGDDQKADDAIVLALNKPYRRS